MENFLKKIKKGQHLKPGDDHYRAYVGPPKDYDLIGAMVFNLLTCFGLKETHKVLDIGCGSLRNGRLLLPYLDKNNYFGVEPNEWLVKDAIKHEIGQSILEIKKPQFSFTDHIPNNFNNFDFIFAQSIFSHTGLDLFEKYVESVSSKINHNGIFLFTFVSGEKDDSFKGWLYPGCTAFRLETIADIGKKFGFYSKAIKFFHPRQQWMVFYKDKNVSEFLDKEDISWNNRLNFKG
jgi:cyclopropane fatty-acyl-phospholipid synthase-like methyltransferase